GGPQYRECPGRTGNTPNNQNMCLQPARPEAPRCDKSLLRRGLVALMLSLLIAPGAGVAQSQSFSFGIIAQPDRIGPSEPALREALASAGRAQLAFVVLTGLKSSAEPCSDRLYEIRKQMLDDTDHDIFISPGAGDWAECRRDD